MDDSRCIFCGAKILDGTCHCGAEGRRMREPDAFDAMDASKAYEAEHPTVLGTAEN